MTIKEAADNWINKGCIYASLLHHISDIFPLKKELDDAYNTLINVLVSEKQSLRIKMPITEQTIIFYYDPKSNSVTEYLCGVDGDGLGITPESEQSS